MMDRPIVLIPEPLTEAKITSLEQKNLLRRLDYSSKLEQVPSGVCLVEDVYISSEDSGPHKLIAVACNRTGVELGVHNEHEEFLVFRGRRGAAGREELPAKPLYLLIALHKKEVLEEKAAAGELSEADFVLCDVPFDDPQLSLFTMFKDTVHTEFTAPRPGMPPIFFVTESARITMQKVLPGCPFAVQFPD